MDWTKRMPGKSSGGTRNLTLPPVIVEVEPSFVFAAQVDRAARRVRRIGACELESWRSEPEMNSIPPAAQAELQRAVQQVLGTIGNGSSKLGLLIPDPIVRVGILEFESLPVDRRDAEALVRWRLKDTVPFPPEELRVTYQVMSSAERRREILAMAARNSVLSDFENVVQDRNGGPVLTLPATAALLPLLPEGEEKGQLLVHVCATWMTVVLVEGDRVRLWRNRDLNQIAETEVSGEVSREIARAVASSRDHHQLEVGRVWVSARRAPGADLLPSLARAASAPVEPLVPGSKLATGLSSGERALFEQFGATVAGLVMNFGGKA